MSTIDPALRARLDAAFDDRDKLSKGWQPPGDLWANAPTLNRWRYAAHPVSGTLALSGYLDGESRLTEPVVAMLTGPAGIGWARTLAGWVRLALTDDREHKAGRMLLPEHAREIEIAARARVRLPRPAALPAALGRSSGRCPMGRGRQALRGDRGRAVGSHGRLLRAVETHPPAAGARENGCLVALQIARFRSRIALAEPGAHPRSSAMRSIFVLAALLVAAPAFGQSRIPPGNSWGTVIREELSPTYRVQGTLRVQREATGWRWRLDCRTQHDSYGQEWGASAWGRATISGDTVRGTAEGGSEPRGVVGHGFQLRLDASGADWISDLPSCPQRAQGARKAR